jgi:hypothetical protein
VWVGLWVQVLGQRPLTYWKKWWAGGGLEPAISPFIRASSTGITRIIAVDDAPTEHVIFPSRAYSACG